MIWGESHFRFLICKNIQFHRNVVLCFFFLMNGDVHVESVYYDCS